MPHLVVVGHIYTDKDIVSLMFLLLQSLVYDVFCDVSSESLCGNPGKPIGGKKFGNQYNEGDLVRFECDPGRSMLGSENRTCLDNGRWTGLELVCIGEQ